MKTLSDEMNLIHCSQCGTDKYLCFSKKDVKEFIKKIEKQVSSIIDFIDITQEDSEKTKAIKIKIVNDGTDFINKLAGKDLI